MNTVPHIPGRNARPAEGSISPGLDEGLALYRAGFFWEAHEAWEPVWMDAGDMSVERQLLQGLIQLANARLKIVMDRPRAALRILELAEGHLADAGQGTLQDWAWSEGESVRGELRKYAL